jgi:hypothetical protein
MEQVSGTYEGEGPNTTAGIALVPDINAAPAGGTNANQTEQTTADTAQKAKGKTASVAITRRRQLRVSSEGSRSHVAVNFGAGDQVLANAARGIAVSTGGTLVFRGPEDTADQTFVFVPGWYPFGIALIRNVGSSGVVGLLLF